MSHERSIEQAPAREIYGVRIENPGIESWKYRLYLTVAAPASFLRRTRIEGGLPTEGPAIVVANHVSYVDAPFVYFVAAKTAGRTLRMIARDDMIDPNLPEDPEILERTHKKPSSKLKRRVLAFCTNIGDPIPVNRQGKSLFRTLGLVDHTLRDEQIVAVSLTETRKPDNDLEDAKPLAALIALRHPDVPVFPVGLSGIELDSKHIFGPVIGNIGEPFYVNQLNIDRSNTEETVATITEELKRRIARLVPDYLKRTYLAHHRQE